MEKLGSGKMVADRDHNTVKTLQYKILECMADWSSEWVAVRAENMRIWEDCAALRKDLEGLKSQWESSTNVELDEIDEGIRQNRLGLQDLFNEKARLKRESSKVEARVKQIEKEIERRLLDKEVVVIEQEELDRIDKLATHYWEHPMDIWKFSAMDMIGEPLDDTIEQNAIKGKLEAKQEASRPSSPDKSKEVKYLKRKVDREPELIDSPEDDFLKQVAEVRRKTKPNKEDGSLKLSFVDVTVQGKRLAALIDTGATHSFVSRKTARSFAKKKNLERESSAFKAVKSLIKAIDGLLKDAQVRVGSWFGRLDLRVVDMDDHSMVLGLDFMRMAQAVPMVDRDLLLITAEGKNLVVPMSRRSCLGYRPRMTFVILYPKDPNIKHTDVERRKFGNIVQSTQERKFIDFISKMGKKDERNKEKASRSWKELVGISSINNLREETTHEAEPGIVSKAKKGEDYKGRDQAGIVEFCRYAMGIYDFQLTKDKLRDLGCDKEEIEAVHEYLRTQHQSDTWVDESQGGNFLAFLSS